MFGALVSLVSVCALAALATIVGALLGKRQLQIRSHSLLQVSHDLDDTRSALAKAQRNVKRGKDYRQLHDKVEAAQFAAVRARDMAMDAAKVADTTAEHLARLLEDE